MRAILSVYDKTGVAEFARGLHELGWELFSTGNTQRVIAEAGVPAAPVHFPEEIADDPQGATHFVEVEHEQLGAQRQAAPIVDLSRSPTAIASGSAALGRHTDEVLREQGISDEEIAELRRSGAVL